MTGSTITLDSAGDITLDAGGADILLKDDGTTYGGLSNNSGELLIKSGTTTAMTFSGANVTLEGNLTVSGTTTTVNSTTVNLNDHNIVLDSGNSTSSVVNGAGITIDGASASITYTNTTDEFDFSKDIHVSGSAGRGFKFNSGGALVAGGASGGDVQLMYFGGTIVYYGRNALGGSVTGHEFRIGGVTKLNVNSSGNTEVTGNLSTTGSISASGNISSGIYEIGDDVTSTSSTSQTTISQFSASSVRSCRFTVQVTNSTDGAYHTTELLLVHDGTTPGITEFGTIFTGAAAEATFDADISGGSVRLRATPASSDSMTFKVVRHMITT